MIIIITIIIIISSSSQEASCFCQASCQVRHIIPWVFTCKFKTTYTIILKQASTTVAYSCYTTIHLCSNTTIVLSSEGHGIQLSGMS